MSSALSTPDLLDYRPRAPFLDELFELDGTPRSAAAALVREIERLGPDGLLEAGRRRDAVFMQQGITFETSGEHQAGATHPGAAKERPFPLDLIPRVLSGAEWRELKRGLAQRIRALNAFVDDVYHAREIVREGLVPWRLVAGCPHFARAVHGIRPPGGVYTHVAGCDLVRHSDGTWKVIEDNVRIPSGISYVLENRAAMAQLVPELFASYRVRPVDHYPQLLLGALRAVAPSAESEATVVVWTPGPANPAYFEHAFLARQMGVELVEASDLVVRDDVLYMRTTRGLERVHAVYRRLDDDFVDPLEFRPDSLLGVPGLVRAYRAGSVAVANAFGTGVADDKAIYRFVPEMIRFYLGEQPILENVRTYLLSDPEVLEHVLGRLDQLVVKPTGESGGRGVLIGPHADERELERMRAVVRADPDRWIAQDLVRLSTVPTVDDDGNIHPRHVDLRPFAVFGERIDIVPGGLTRVALEEGSMIVNSSRGGGSKDTWVLQDGDDADRAGPTIADTLPPALPDLRYGEWTGQQQQQQQNRRHYPLHHNPTAPIGGTQRPPNQRQPNQPPGGSGCGPGEV
ncbi:MAG TPA: circularly permuted type 2 ATP-grasp protein [Solirubrobacteraceae bacterium]|nr:circularly permuted type 2 ATP-grasp protein [Solirubrobacteraceae bacterium]